LIFNHNIDISRGYSPSKFPQLDNSQLYNFYISAASGKPALYPTAGHEKIGDFSYGTFARGIFKSNILNKLVVVFNDNVFLVDEQGNHFLLNQTEPLSTANTKVYIQENNVNQIAFSDGTSVYAFNTQTSVFSKAVLPDGVVPGMIDYKDDRFILNNKSNNEWHLSDFNNALVWDALLKTTIDSKTVGVVSFKRQVIVFGDNNATIFYDAGTVGFPYQRSNTIFFEYGCVNADSIAVSSNYVFWVGQNNDSSPQIMVSDGGEPKILTQGDISFIINQLKFVEECQAFSYQVDSHIFYQINWIKDEVSLLYDLSTNRFSIVTGASSSLHPIRYVTRFNNTQYALSSMDGNLYKFDVDLYSENGKAITRTFFSKNYSHANDERIKFVVSKLKVDMEQGMANVPDTACDPSCRPCRDAECYMSISHDKGVTFPITMIRKLAKQGNRIDTLDFYNLGSGRFWAFKFRFVSPDRVAIFDINFDATEENIE
jgi:hypothetical protein